MPRAAGEPTTPPGTGRLHSWPLVLCLDLQKIRWIPTCLTPSMAAGKRGQGRIEHLHAAVASVPTDVLVESGRLCAPFFFFVFTIMIKLDQTMRLMLVYKVYSTLKYISTSLCHNLSSCSSNIFFPHLDSLVVHFLLQATQ
jgi:hypothetical protein